MEGYADNDVVFSRHLVSTPGGGSAARPASGAGLFGFFGSGTEMGLIGMGGNGF